MGEKIAASHGVALTQAKDITQASLSLKADVVVVGSGAGGAVMAYELARAGKSVIVLEAGPYVPSSEFTEEIARAMDTLYADHGGQTNKDGDILILQGRCVGGSTVVNGCVAFRTPDFVLQTWQRDHGLSNLTTSALTPYFEKVEERLSIHENQEYEINRNSAKVREGCQKLGISWKPLKRNIKNCALTGHCLSGCATDRKQSMLVTYLPWAVAEGAKIYADTKVVKVLAENGKASGVVAEVIDPATGVKKADLIVTAKLVVLAAGAVQTPLLLQKSRMANSSGQVGKNFACHPSVGVVAEYAEDVHPWRGAMLGVYVDEWATPEKGSFLLEAGMEGPLMLSTLTMPGVGKPFADYMANVKNVVGMASLIHDHNVGEVHWNDEKKVIDYRLADVDFPSMQATIKAAAKIHFAAGATQVFLPLVKSHAPCTSYEQVEAAVNALANDPQVLRMVSYHPQGTCRMGADRTRSVVGPAGETHDVKNLYVCDASLLPTSIMVNPQLTIYALSSYIADGIVKNQAAVFA